MRFHLSLPGCAVALFCLTSMAGCPNNVPAGQLTDVKGRVVNVRTGRPMAGVRMALVSTGQYPGASGYYQQETDSTWTDLQGGYSFSFTNEYGQYYGVNCEGLDGYRRPYLLDLPDSLISSGYYRNMRIRDLAIGRHNVANFQPSPRRVFAVRVMTRRTGYQRLSFIQPPQLPADNQQRMVYIYQSVPYLTNFPQQFNQHPGTPPGAKFSRTLANSVVQDTSFWIPCRAPLTGDTVQGSLLFGL